MAVGNLQFATILATFTPQDGSPPIQLQSQTWFDEEEFLGETQPAKERGRRFMSTNGVYSQVIQRYATNGKRDITVFDMPQCDQLVSIAQRNPYPIFDFAFRYQREQSDVTSIRVHYHWDCFIENTPFRAISNEIAVVKFTINYGRVQLQDGNGAPI